MFSPLKSFLSSLQKNAISATIFGLSPNMTSQGETDLDSASMQEPGDQLLSETITGITGNANQDISSESRLAENIDSSQYANPDVIDDLSAADSVEYLNPKPMPVANFTDSMVEPDGELFGDATTVELLVKTDEQMLLTGEDSGSLGGLGLTFAKVDAELLSESDADTFTELHSHPVILADPETLAEDLIDDPLNEHMVDPLALEDILSNEGSNSVNTADTDLDGEGQVTIVDVKLLKKDGTVGGSETEPDDSYETTVLDIGETGEECVRSDGSDSGLGSDSTTLPPSISVRPINSDIVPTRSNLKRRSDNVLPDTSAKRQKKNITFNEVTVYYFPRTQGFTCVPSQGGCTLGMESQHIHLKSFSLAEHAAEQRRVHRQQLQDLHPNGSSTEETESDEEQSENSGSEFDTESSGFLQPVNARQRRNMLKAVGIRKIDSIEKDECRTIRTSREFCGCNCRGYCDPDTCSCSQNGIKCQVDRQNFPCGCTRDGCGNVVGRVEFNPVRVRTHFIHTIMRLELEKKHNRTEDQSSFNNPDNLNWNQPSSCMQPIGLDNITHYSNIYSNNSNSNSLSTSIVDNRAVNVCNSVNINQTVDGAHLMELNQMRSPGNESLDLHYAYRDEYATSIVHSSDDVRVVLSNDDQSICLHKIYEQNSNTAVVCTYAGFNGNDNFTNYSEAAAYDVQTPHADDENSLVSVAASHSTYSASFHIDPDTMSDTAPTKNTTELNNVPSPSPTTITSSTKLLECDKELVNLLPLAADSNEMHAINDLLENSRNAFVTAPATQLTSSEQTEMSASLNNFHNTLHKEQITEVQENSNFGDQQESGKSSLLNAVDPETGNLNEPSASTMEMHENLSEVIKKSIVETSSSV